MKPKEEQVQQDERLMALIHEYEKPIIAAQWKEYEEDFARRSAYADELINGK
jgi:hypothetical protein